MKFNLPSFFKKKKSKSLKGIDTARWCLWAGVGVGVLVGFLYWLGFFSTLEARSLDLWMRLRGPQPVNQAIKIIGIDDISLNAFGRWPWPRSYHANMLAVRRLRVHRVRAPVGDAERPEHRELAAPGPENREKLRPSHDFVNTRFGLFLATTLQLLKIFQ